MGKKDTSNAYAHVLLLFMLLTAVNSFSSLNQSRSVSETVLLKMAIIGISLLILINMICIAYNLVKNNINNIVKNHNEFFSFTNIIKQFLIQPLTAITIFSIFLVYDNIISLEISLSFNQSYLFHNKLIDISAMDIDFGKNIIQKGNAYVIKLIIVLLMIAFLIPSLVCGKAFGYANECTITEIHQIVLNLLHLEEDDENNLNEQMIIIKIQQQVYIELLFKSNKFLTMLISFNTAEKIQQSKESNIPPLASI